VKLEEAAIISGLSVKTLRRYIIAGILPASLVSTSGRASRYDLHAEDVARLTGKTHTPDTLSAFMSETTRRLDALEAIIISHQGKMKAPHDTAVSMRRCAELARAHGVGYWTVRDEWKIAPEERADEETALATIRNRAKARFTECDDPRCPCQNSDSR